MVDGDWPMEWSAKYQFVADDPNKVTMKERDDNRAQVSAALVPLAQGRSRGCRSSLPISCQEIAVLRY